MLEKFENRSIKGRKTSSESSLSPSKSEVIQDTSDSRDTSDVSEVVEDSWEALDTKIARLKKNLQLLGESSLKI